MGKIVKAAVGILSGIFLLLFYMEMKLSMDGLPPEAQQVINANAPNTIAFIYALLIYSIISSFVWAAVNIAQAIIGRKERMQLAELGKRIDSLDQRLSMGTMSFAPTAMGVGPGQPMAQPQMMTAPEKSSSKVKIAVIAVVAIIVIAAIALALVMFVFNGGGTPGGETPVQSFNTFIDRMDSKNAEGVIGQTMWTFASNRSDYVSMMQQKVPSGTFHVAVTQGPTVFYTQQMNQTETAEVEARMAQIESDYDVSISNYAVISFQMTITMSQGSMTMSDRLPCFQIEDRWYLDAENLFSGDNDQNNNPNDQNPDNQIQVSLAKSGPSANNWTLTVTGVSGTQSLMMSDVYLTIMDASSNPIIDMRPLMSFTSGDYSDGVTCHDNGISGQLDTSDYMMLDDSVFSQNYVVRLTDASGDNNYAEITL